MLISVNFISFLQSCIVHASLEEERHFEITDSKLFCHCVLCIILQLSKLLRAAWLVAIVKIQTSDPTHALCQSKNKANSARTFSMLL